jgi:hypothetical protein
MTIFRVRVQADKYPVEFTVEATSWATAIARAIREWKKKNGKGSRTTEVSVKAWKQGNLLQDKE